MLPDIVFGLEIAKELVLEDPFESGGWLEVLVGARGRLGAGAGILFSGKSLLT